MDDVIILLSQEQTQDEYGVWRETLTETRVFCKVNSINRAEFFNAGRNGLNPSYRFDVFHADYNGEEMCKYGSDTYAIYRAYRVPNSDYTELYAERKGGTNGKGDSD